jgi:hypothetical protein
MFFPNYSRVDAEDRVTAELTSPVEAVPEESLNFGFVVDFAKHWLFGLSGYHRAGWTSQTALPLTPIDIPGYGIVKTNFVDQLDFPDYTVINTQLSWRDVFRGTDFMLDLENVLDDHMYFGDQHFFAPGGVPTGGRIVKLGIRHRF